MHLSVIVRIYLSMCIYNMYVWQAMLYRGNTQRFGGAGIVLGLEAGPPRGLRAEL